MSPPAIIGVPRAVPRIDLGVGDARSAQGLGQWQPDAGGPADTRWQPEPPINPAATWNGEEPYWVDVTCYGIEIETYTGRDRATDQWEVGTATIVLDNTTGWADYPPTATPNPFSLTVRPGRQIRVAVTVDGGDPQVLWRGWVDQANPGFDAEDSDIVTLECIDTKGEIGRVAVAAVDPAVGASESIQARLGRICGFAGAPEFWRNFEGTAINVVATTLGAQAADLLNRAADSGGGSLFGDVDGKLRYRNRDWQLWPADEPEDATIGNVAAGDVCPTAWEMAFAREDLTTRVLVGRADMTEPFVLDDEDGQELYGIETVGRIDLETVLDVELTQLGNRLLATRGYTTMPRVAGVTLNAATDPAVVDLLATADPRTPSRFRCRHVSGDRQVFSRFMFCTAIRHTIGPDMWEARLSLDDAVPWQIGADAGFWSETETVGAAHWEQSTWQAEITPP